MKTFTSFSFRIPRDLATAVEAGARQLGLSKAEYVRRALQQFQAQHMRDRIAELSRRVARQSAAVAGSMDRSGGDGLE